MKILSKKTLKYLEEKLKEEAKKPMKSPGLTVKDVERIAKMPAKSEEEQDASFRKLATKTIIKSIIIYNFWFKVYHSYRYHYPDKPNPFSKKLAEAKFIAQNNAAVLLKKRDKK